MTDIEIQNIKKVMKSTKKYSISKPLINIELDTQCLLETLESIPSSRRRKYIMAMILTILVNERACKSYSVDLFVSYGSKRYKRSGIIQYLDNEKVILKNKKDVNQYYLKDILEVYSSDKSINTFKSSKDINSLFFLNDKIVTLLSSLVGNSDEHVDLELINGRGSRGKVVSLKLDHVELKDVAFSYSDEDSLGGIGYSYFLESKVVLLKDIVDVSTQLIG